MKKRQGAGCRVSGVVVATVGLMWAVAATARAQQGSAWDFRAPLITRAQLQQVLARYQAAAASPAYSAELRRQLAEDMDSIRSRLANGDMRVGERLRVTVEGQAQLSDTFAVSAGPALTLPVVGSVNLAGALRSELEGRIAQSVDSVYRGAVVHVQPLTRIAVVGGVARPGFYSLSQNMVLADVLTAAGGLAPDGQLGGAYAARGAVHVVPPDSMQTAIQQGRTIASLGLRDGDRIVVPVQAPQSATQTIQVFTYLFSAALSLFTLSRVL